MSEFRSLLQDLLADGQWGSKTAKENDWRELPRFLRERRETIQAFARLFGLMQENRQPQVNAVIMVPPQLPRGLGLGPLLPSTHHRGGPGPDPRSSLLPRLYQFAI
jgi:hypothetical protein